MDKQHLSVPDSHRFQHYKDRCAPWIKLHRDIFTDYAFCRLKDEAKFHLFAIRLLAAQNNNELAYDKVWIERQIGSNSSIDFEVLIKAGFLNLSDAEESG